MFTKFKIKNLSVTSNLSVSKTKLIVALINASIHETIIVPCAIVLLTDSLVSCLKIKLLTYFAWFLLQMLQSNLFTSHDEFFLDKKRALGENVRGWFYIKTSKEELI